MTYYNAVANAVAVLVYGAKATTLKRWRRQGACRQDNVAQALVDLETETERGRGSTCERNSAREREAQVKGLKERRHKDR